MVTDYVLEAVEITRSPFAELVAEEAQHNPGPAECGVVTWYDYQGYLMDNSGRAKAVYFDRVRRGAIDDGGGWQWTDAASIEDVVDRYVGNGDKEMAE